MSLTLYFHPLASYCHKALVALYENETAGGRERLSVGPEGGSPHVFEARYHDVLADRRIIYAYDMYVGAERISISLATIEFEAKGRGTRMLFTEQGAFFNGDEDAKERAEGTRLGLDNLAADLERWPE